MLARKAFAVVFQQAAASRGVAAQPLRAFTACARVLSDAALSPATSGADTALMPERAQTLTKRQRQVYERPEDLPVSPSLRDHGYLYGLEERHLEGRSDAVRRALSTRTANTQGALKFRRSELVRKFAPEASSTGSSVVQVRHRFACFSTQIRPAQLRSPTRVERVARSRLPSLGVGLLSFQESYDVLTFALTDLITPSSSPQSFPSLGCHVY